MRARWMEERKLRSLHSSRGLIIIVVIIINNIVVVVVVGALTLPLRLRLTAAAEYRSSFLRILFRLKTDMRGQSSLGFRER